MSYFDKLLMNSQSRQAGQAASNGGVCVCVCVCMGGACVCECARVWCGLAAHELTFAAEQAASNGGEGGVVCFAFIYCCTKGGVLI